MFLLLVVFTPGVMAQQGPGTAATQTSSYGAAGERDKEMEDQVAQLFERIRTEAKLPAMKRIEHRDGLEQGVCTSVLTGNAPKTAMAFYTTADASAITPELTKAALSNRLDAKKRPIYTRYSVAVWRVKGGTAAKEYHVGVGLYSSAGTEFVDCHFTDDIHYCGMWKESIAPSCRGK
jgi:hypothetical protein